MQNYFLVNYSTLTALSLGEIPETWGNITGLDKSRPEWMKRMIDFGYNDYGFLTYDEAITENISVSSLNDMRSVYLSVAWEEIKAERDKRKTEGVKVGNLWFHSDVNSKFQHLGNKDSATEQLANGRSMNDTLLSETGQPIIWKCMSYQHEPLVLVPMTLQLAFDVVSVIKASEFQLHQFAELQYKSMSESEYPENYDYMQGWPDTFYSRN